MSDPTGSSAMRARVDAGNRRGGKETLEALPPTPRQQNAEMTAKERRKYEEENPNSYGPGTMIGRSGRVFNVIPGREPGTFTGILNKTLTEERFEGLNRPASTPREPSGRSTSGQRGRGGRRGGGGGSTTLLTADGLDSSRTGQRRTVLGA